MLESTACYEIFVIQTTELFMFEILLSFQELMHHIGLYMSKGRGAKVVSEVSFDTKEP